MRVLLTAHAFPPRSTAGVEVYTLRLAYQPMDGDHMGTAPYSEFCLLVGAEMDTKPDLLEHSHAHSMRRKHYPEPRL